MDEATALLDRGAAALRRGDWAAARSAFDALIEVAPCAEAFEGLSEAAWWQDDADVVFEARERAYQLYREAGDNLGAARIAMWQGTDYLDFRGETAISNGWRQLAGKLLADLPTSAEHGWFAAFEGDIALLLEEDTEAALRWAQEAIAIGRRLSNTDIEALATAVEGLALVNEGDISNGMSRLDQAAAAALAGDLKEFFSFNTILCHLIYACERARDYTRAAQWCQRAREHADKMGFAFAQGVCRVHYAGVLVWRGKWSEAEQELSEASRFLITSRPPYESEARVRLAELRRKQGRQAEATGLFLEVDWHPLAAQGLAELALDAGRLLDAREYVQRVLRQIPEKTVSQRSSALELLVRIQCAEGQHESARETLQRLAAISDAVATRPLQAAVDSLAGLLAAADGDFAAAITHFEDAAVGFDRSGAPYETARNRVHLAEALRETGRIERAVQEASSALQSFKDLGASADVARTESLLSELKGADAPPGNNVLTARQIEVLRLVAEGSSDREVAAALVMSEHTVHRHIANILLRLGVPSRAAAVAQASRLGLL